MLAGALTKAVQPNASVAATGPGIRYIGEKPQLFTYGFSGIVPCRNNNTLIMEFTTGSGFIDMQLLVFNGSGDSDDFLYTLYLNEIISVQWYALGVQDPLAGKNPIPLLIPPFTKFTLRGDNQGSSTERNHTANFIGRVYGA